MNNRFQKRVILTQEILQKISKIDEFKGLWRGSIRLSPQILGRLKRSVIITSTGSSTRIEGSKMSDDEVAKLLQGLKSAPPKGRDAQEVAGYADLLGRIFDNWKTFKITESYILQFHKILLSFSDKDELHRGKYKTTDNRVVMIKKDGEEVTVFDPTPPYLTKKEMDDVLFWLKEETKEKSSHSLILVANFIFEFLAIHPFRDGNGRLSRALTTLLLLKAGYTYVPYVSLDEIIEERKIDYYWALRKTQSKHKTKNEDIALWLNFFLDVLLEQIRRAKEIMDKDQPEKLLSEKQLRIYQLFEADELSVSEIEKMLNSSIPMPTIKQALSRLVDLKLIERIGVTRGARYRKL
ncbi:MAG: Fic family protein [uncultured bacterium]|nr:MAG: Fic family protein [uncultured bacterium]KKP67776.1 MAG: Filamentation induced by cAMP protein Fic [Candidatus Moranbacteria bacterium GW2011_GWE1_35_17]KKP71910.1 MAG: Filamentation induced by cAMP protein Fic [Candidatus Moranbacteria bacterium GW2011_GWE2_35_164]KKP80585.1 MAG: Filamentation induced by cAMP protein Fic [Candidatus Moranbacteria bacterium GW2011_GWF1_35_5]KKP83209.1 MAG: Filamentation induced by cAMP protein Fic [Candidatus Moranbacteria bacterium GW2011_GWF2_35_54]H